MSDAIPVIDLRDDSRAVARAIDRACVEWGFFHVTGHGVPESCLDEALHAMRRFFALPQAAKRRIERTAENAWGYYDRELTKNRRDWKEIFDVGPTIEDGELAGNRPQWPADLPAFRAPIERLYAAFEQLARRLATTIGENLGDAATVDAACGDRHTSFLRLNYYPLCDEPARADAEFLPAHGQLGIHPHTDAGALTVLLQDGNAALQVHRDGAWHLVQPRADSLLINIGDVVQVWANDLYRAALHRVLASPSVPRFSAAFFLNPSSETVYAPIGNSAPRDAPRYRPIRWSEFRAARAAGDYADVGEEIQISHYRIG
jgi:isopenicillin N synthase-like dioxygenase